MRIFFEVFWLLQRLIRRKIGFAKIADISISINQVTSYNLIANNFLRETRELKNYKQPLNDPNKIVNINSPVLNPKTGVIWIKRQILEESSVWPVSKLLKWEPTPFFPQKIKKISLNLPDNGFYHFVIEDLPRFCEAFRNHEFDQVVIGSKSDYVLDTLNFLKIKNYIIKKYPVTCEELIFSEKNIGGIFTKSDHIELLNFSNGIKSSSNDQILFIDRKNKHKGYLDRGLKYADIITHKLKNFNTVKVYLEDLSLVDQISLFKSSKLVIGFHGAGLANMVWIDRTVKIFEITENRITSHFEHIASVCGHEFTMLKASELAKNGIGQISKLLDT